MHHVAILTTDGRIYQWGKTLVEEEDEWKVLEPQFLSGILDGKYVIQVDCGQGNPVALTRDGEVYSWGYNLHGQLGTGHQADEMQPVRISGSNGFDVHIVSVACGGWNSYALDCDGNVIGH